MRFAIWLTAAIGSAIVLSWLAVEAAAYFAPLVVFPTALGLALGGVVILVARVTDTAHRSSVLAGTLLAGAILALGQHYASYLSARAVESSATTALAAHAFPELQDRLNSRNAGFVEFMRDSANHGMTLAGATLRPRGVWLFWIANALVTISTATIVTAIALRQSYCDRCGSWYRLTRHGRLDAEVAAAVGDCLGCANSPSETAQYEIRTCRGGCEPAGCTLLWKGAPGRREFAWLDRSALARVNSLIH
ncbi:MAG TPA: hypothetical protein VGN12_03835 [Pirellulales bacterium]